MGRVQAKREEEVKDTMQSTLSVGMLSQFEAQRVYMTLNCVMQLAIGVQILELGYLHANPDFSTL